MRLLSALLVIFSLNCITYAGEVREIHVERRDIGEVLGKYVLPVSMRGKGYISKEIWRSPKGIVCTVSLFEHSSKTDGTFECVSPENYKAQIALDCAVNSNSKTAVYMFFGMIGDGREVGNFYVWCA